MFVHHTGDKAMNGILDNDEDPGGDEEEVLRQVEGQWCSKDDDEARMRLAAEVYCLIEKLALDGQEGVGESNINQASRILENYTEASHTEVSIPGHNKLWIQRNLAIQSKGAPLSSQGFTTSCRGTQPQHEPAP